MYWSCDIKIKINHVVYILKTSRTDATVFNQSHGTVFSLVRDINDNCTQNLFEVKKKKKKKYAKIFFNLKIRKKICVSYNKQINK